MNDDSLIACTLSRWTGDKRRCRWCNVALSGRQRRWCGDDCPSLMIDNHWWASARAAALRRDGDACVRCGRRGTDHGVGERGLEVHHRDEHAKGRHHASSCCHHVDGLETLCRPCHIDEHRTRPVPRKRPGARSKALPVPRAMRVPRRLPALPPVVPQLRPDRVAQLARLAAVSPAPACEVIPGRALLAGMALRYLAGVGAAHCVSGIWTITPYGTRLLDDLQASKHPGLAA